MKLNKTSRIMQIKVTAELTKRGLPPERIAYYFRVGSLVPWCSGTGLRGPGFIMGLGHLALVLFVCLGQAGCASGTGTRPQDPVAEYVQGLQDAQEPRSQVSPEAAGRAALEFCRSSDEALSCSPEE